MTRPPLVIVGILGLPILIAAAILGPTAFDLVFHRRPPERFLIPAGYSGWVRIDFRQKGAPPLPMEDGRRLLKLNEQGSLQTSSDPQAGHGRDDFFYYTGEHRTPLRTLEFAKAAWSGKLKRWLTSALRHRLSASSSALKLSIAAKSTRPAKSPPASEFDVPRLLHWPKGPLRSG